MTSNSKHKKINSERYRNVINQDTERQKPSYSSELFYRTQIIHKYNFVALLILFKLLTVVIYSKNFKMKQNLVKLKMKYWIMIIITGTLLLKNLIGSRHTILPQD